MFSNRADFLVGVAALSGVCLVLDGDVLDLVDLFSVVPVFFSGDTDLLLLRLLLTLLLRLLLLLLDLGDFKLDLLEGDFDVDLCKSKFFF